MSTPSRNPSAAVRERFGAVAVRKGFASAHQVSQALTLQGGRAAADLPHRLIGMIMLESGALGTTELSEVLREMNAPISSGGDPRPAP